VVSNRNRASSGKVERMVHYLKDNLLNGRHFADLKDLNTQARVWLQELQQLPPARYRSVRLIIHP
jgi:transposase